MSTVAVVQYPGSNCDLDALEILQKVERVKTDLVWHKDLKRDTYDAYVLPGGFSYGDYLRAGAIAAHSPSIHSIQDAAENGKPVLGICNGFQVLVEAGLLPGAILRNSGLQFVCRWTNLRVENAATPFTRTMKRGQVVHFPIAHNEGRFYIDPGHLNELEKNEQIIMRYVDSHGDATDGSNPNGSLDNIAAISNPEHNIMGLMPHPERASISDLSPYKTDEGRQVFHSMVRSVQTSEESK